MYLALEPRTREIVGTVMLVPIFLLVKVGRVSARASRAGV